MKNHSVKIGKTEFPLLFTLGTMQLMEERISGFDLTKIDEILHSAGGLLDVLYCLAEQAAIAEGKPLKEDRAWFGSHAPASRIWIVKAHEEIVAALVDGMNMETDDDDGEEVDVVLEELKKKDEKTD